MCGVGVEAEEKGKKNKKGTLTLSTHADIDTDMQREYGRRQKRM